jgi:hypothetical protein
MKKNAKKKYKRMVGKTWLFYNVSDRSKTGLVLE